MDQKQAIKSLLSKGTLPTVDKVQSLVDKPVVLSRHIVKTGPVVNIIKNYSPTPQKLTVKDFSTTFQNRYLSLKKILLNRPENQDAISISKAKQLQGEQTTIIAAVLNISKFKTGTICLDLEDLSGQTRAIISQKNPELREAAKFIALDEILAFQGVFTKDFFLIKNIVWPDIPIKQPKKFSEDVYIAFSGDIHAGSNMFLPKELNKFVKWLRGEVGNESQKEIARKTKYVFFVGDIVDGVGVYPNQEEELHIKDIYKQFDEVAKYLKEIPEDKKIIICPGNHDALRIAEPQPAFDKHFAAPLYELPNVILVSNPAIVNIHSVGDFPGINVLMYHGYSFDGLINDVEGLRLVGGYDRPDEIMKFVLKRRHLAPTYGSTLVLPLHQDPLLVDQVPDVLVTGHLHKSAVGNYRGVLTIAASCWQAKTSFMEKVGHHPEPGKVPLLNLKNWRVKLMDFS